jgi:hypothetical protein
MKRTAITIAWLMFAIFSSPLEAAPIIPLGAGNNFNPSAITTVYYYRPYYASPYYRPYYRPYYYNPYYVPYYYYGCRRFYSWGYMQCVW